jgi:hypothetical protein
MRNILIIFILFYSISVKSQKLELSLAGSSTTFEIGQEIELKLSIINIDGQLAHQSNNSEMVIDLKDFEKRIVVICNSAGSRSFGPYKIKLNNKVFESNQVSVNIVKPSITTEVTDTIISLAVPEVINKGEKFTIILKSNIPLNSLSKEIDINNFDDLSQLSANTIKVRNNSKIEQLNSSYSSSVSIKDGNRTSEYIYTFEINAKKKGVVQINHLFFEPQLPKELKTKLIEVK